MFLDFLVIYTYGYVKKDKHENWFMDNGKESVVYLIRIQKVFIHINKFKKKCKKIVIQRLTIKINSVLWNKIIKIFYCRIR